MIRNSEGWIREYQKKDAYWLHDGNPKRPHALLTSGKHSNGFFNSRLVIPDEILLREAAFDLLELFPNNGGDIWRVCGVVGPQTGGTRLAKLIMELIFLYTGNPYLSASPKKRESEGKKSMVFSDEEFRLLPNRTTLLCDDVLTTSGSVDLTAKACTDAGGIVLPFVLVLVNRSGMQEVSGRRIVSLIDRHMPTWEEEECPLCKEGSEAIRPKDTENWICLNADY